MIQYDETAFKRRWQERFDMDIRFVAHAPYIDNRENLSCIELLHALNWAVPRRLDSLERIDDVPDTLGELKELLGVVNESDFATIVPVGDLGFVSRWLTLMPNAADPSMTPIEIPPALRKFAGRRWRLSLGDELLGDDFDSHKTFLKDADTLKKWNSLLCGGDMSGLVDRDTTYAVSEKVDLVLLLPPASFPHSSRNGRSYSTWCERCRRQEKHQALTPSTSESWRQAARLIFAALR